MRLTSRARAWQATGVVLLPTAVLAAGPRRWVRRGKNTWCVAGGLLLALVGYPLGRAILGDKPIAPPQDGLSDDVLGLGLLALTEELVWGRQVEPVLSVPLTAAMFAIKHPLIDGRWRRVLGLALFWLGLALVRPRSPAAAAVAHVVANASGVLLGHLIGVDQF